jgi:periplasmic divalent cation tolerance protein
MNNLLYVTCASEEEAVAIGTKLVEERLCACANVLGHTTSIFWWEGKVQQANEVALIVKSRAELVERVTERVKQLHSYSVPCVVALPIEGGNPAFLNWIEQETAMTPAVSRF